MLLKCTFCLLLIILKQKLKRKWSEEQSRAFSSAPNLAAKIKSIMFFSSTVSPHFHKALFLLFTISFQVLALMTHQALCLSVL